MKKSRTPECDELPAEAQPHARAFLAVAKPYASNEVARVLTNLHGGANFTGCGKDYCAASYAKAMLGDRVGPADSRAIALRTLTMEQLKEDLMVERARLVRSRQAKAENEARWKREALERDLRRDALAQVVKLLGMVLDDMSICYGECGADYEFKELSEETVEALNAYRSKIQAGAQLIAPPKLDSQPAPAAIAAKKEAL